MEKRKWYRKYRCRSCGAVCDPGELAAGRCFDCRDAAECREAVARASVGFGVDFPGKEPADGRPLFEERLAGCLVLKEHPDGQLVLEVM